jgi:membrane protein DedA with SNARE-associated domain/rhodanese-related sulfurtransferase
MQHLVHLVALYGPLLVFVAVFCDELGLPVPSLPILVVAGALLWTDHFAFTAVIVAAVAATLSADLIWYWAGRRFGRRILSILCRISLSPDSCVRRTETLFNKIGFWSLIFARYVPAFTNLSVAMAAIARVPVGLFLALNVVGGLLYYGAAAAVGAIFHHAMTDILNTMATFGAISLVAIASAFALYILIRWWERVVFARRLRMDRITVEELINLIEGDNKPIILDVRSAEARQRDGAIPGSLSAHPEAMHPQLKDLPPDTEIIIYCACPNEATAAIATLHLKRAGFKKIRPLLGGIEAWTTAGRKLEMM